jgi:hypothetical protein
MTKPNSALQAGGDETPVAIRELIEDLCSAAVSYGERDTKDAENAYYAAKAKLIGATRPTPAAAAEQQIAWRATTPVYRQFVTQSQYEKFSPAVQKWYEPFRCASCAAFPVAPAGVPTDELHQRIMNLPCNVPEAVTVWDHDEYTDAYKVGHRDARHAAAELVSAVLSAGAPAVPLQHSDSVHQAVPGSSRALRAASKDALRPVAEAA